MSDAHETRQLEECDQYKVDDNYAEYNAYRRMLEHARQMEMQRDAARGIVLACHRSFIGGSDFCQAEARRLSADLVRKISSPNVKEHTTLSAGASVDHGVEVETREEHVNRAADRGCCVSTCSAFFD